MSSSATARPPLRLIDRRQVAELLEIGECIDAVEKALGALARGEAFPPAALGVHVDGGGFHVKAAGLRGDRSYFAAKVNGNFYRNAERGLPRIQGLIVLADAADGTPLAVMDSTEITAQRTAAASAVAARHLARADAATLTLAGCGLQGRYHLEALSRVRPIRIAHVFDQDPATAERFAREMTGRLSIEILPTRDFSSASRASDVIVTATPSNQALLFGCDVSPGAFVAAVGADSEEKQELDPALLRGTTLVVDQIDQCAAIGELHHALDAGVLTRADVHAELHQVVGGLRPGRRSDEEITVFDSTGIALEDVAAAALVFERAAARDVGVSCALS